MLAAFLPLLFMAVFVFALIRKVKVYDSFVAGAKGAVRLVVSVFPYMAVMFLLSELLEKSGLEEALLRFLSPVLSALGIPSEIGKLLLVKPFSGSGATALLSEIFARYGADSYIARCACVCYGSSETVFYVAAVYFAEVKNKSLAAGIVISLVATFLAAIFGCLLCRIL